MTIKIAHISSVNSLNQISSLGEIDFCLAPYCIKYDKYKQYFINQIKNKRYVIMDDTIAETGGSLSFDILVNLAIEMQVSELILPDVIGDYQKTKDRREEFLYKYFDILNKNNIKLQSVIQGENYYEYLSSLNELINDIRINIIGLPFRMNYSNFNQIRSKEENNMMNRLLFIESNLLENCSKEIHCLGANLVKEIIQLNKYKSIRSVDSKICSRIGKSLQIFDINDYTKPSTKLDIEDELNEEQIDFAIKNILKLKGELV